MGKYAVKRVLSMIPLLIVISIIIFMFVRLIPGDPARQIGGPTATIGEIENIRRELGLDQPLVPQYLQWITGIFQGDLGHSFTNNTSVADLLAPRLPITIYLTICWKSSGCCLRALTLVSASATRSIPPLRATRGARCTARWNRCVGGVAAGRGQ